MKSVSHTLNNGITVINKKINEDRSYIYCDRLKGMNWVSEDRG